GGLIFADGILVVVFETEHLTADRVKPVIPRVRRLRATEEGRRLLQLASIHQRLSSTQLHTRLLRKPIRRLGIGARSLFFLACETIGVPKFGERVRIL